ETGGSGALVTEVVDGSPADAAGVEVGDSIVAVDGVTITGPAGLIATIRDVGPGSEVRLELRRGGRDVAVVATLAERPAE
ncbi:MAG: PDZ domain-containing protein, partial [Ilumatobacteraceae bacterium]